MKYNGLFPCSGSIDVLTFYESNGQHLARRKSSLDAARFFNDPAFDGIRRHGKDFRKAIVYSQSLRKLLAPLMKQVTREQVTCYFNGAMLKVIQADTVHANGERDPFNGDLELLEGFRFRKEVALQDICSSKYSSSVDWFTGETKFSMPSFVPTEVIKKAPAGATHFKILSGVAELTYHAIENEFRCHESELMPLNDIPTMPIELKPMDVSPRYWHAQVAVAGIAFYKVSDTGKATVIPEGVLEIMHAGKLEPARREAMRSQAVTVTPITETAAIIAEALVAAEPISATTEVKEPEVVVIAAPVTPQVVTQSQLPAITVQGEICCRI